MKLSIQDIISVTMILFAVIDIIGSLPVIIETRNRVGVIHSEKATLASLVIMVLFLFLGESILKLIGIDVSSFAIAGSLVIFFLALEMILGIRLYRDDIPETASIVPIAFPLIAGTGTMTTLISLRAQYDIATILIGISLNMIVASNNKTRSQRREETCLVTKSDFQSIRQSKREHDEFQSRQKRRMALKKTKERH
jgi:multiple antibiotic resistance protein